LSGVWWSGQQRQFRNSRDANPAATQLMQVRTTGNSAQVSVADSYLVPSPGKRESVGWEANIPTLYKERDFWEDSSEDVSSSKDYNGPVIYSEWIILEYQKNCWMKNSMEEDPWRDRDGTTTSGGTPCCCWIQGNGEH
jgi:hypothetical protein